MEEATLAGGLEPAWDKGSGSNLVTRLKQILCLSNVWACRDLRTNTKNICV